MSIRLLARSVSATAVILCAVAMWIACTRSISYFARSGRGGQFVCTLTAGSIGFSRAASGTYVPGLQLHDPPQPLNLWIQFTTTRIETTILVPMWMPLVLSSLLLGWSWRRGRDDVADSAPVAASTGGEDSSQRPDAGSDTCVSPVDPRSITLS